MRNEASLARAPQCSNKVVTATAAIPALFCPHPNLSGEINRNIVEAEMQGGVSLERLPRGTRLEVKTRHNVYTIICESHSELICGHPQFCPQPVRVRIQGSTWGGSMLWARFIGRGMHLEFIIPDLGRVTTSPVQEIRELAA